MYKATLPYVFSIVSRYISDIELRRDIVQETYASLFSKIDQFDSDRGEFKSWLRKITVNESLMYLRKTKNISLLCPLSSTEKEISEEIRFDALGRRDVDNLLSKMPEGYKLVFMMFVLDGFSHKEIAQKLEIREDSSRSQLARSKKWILKNIFGNRKEDAYGVF